MLFSGLVGLVTGILDAVVGSQAVSGIATIALLLPSVAAGIRRLHDTGRTGWWLLIAFVPIVGFIVLLVFLVTEGKHEDNKYGPDPKGATAFA